MNTLTSFVNHHFGTRDAKVVASILNDYRVPIRSVTDELLMGISKSLRNGLIQPQTHLLLKRLSLHEYEWRDYLRALKLKKKPGFRHHLSVIRREWL